MTQRYDNFARFFQSTFVFFILMFTFVATMVLNYIWIAFFLIAFVVALVKFRRRHGISRYDGFHVLLVEDRL